MAAVFISYAKEDSRAAQMLADALTRLQFPVWWDRQIPPGSSWDEAIGRALDAAACVIVLWSRISIQSRWVREEAVRAAARGCLIPVLLEDVFPPFGFGLIQAADLSRWRGDEQDPKFTSLLNAVSEMARASTLAPMRGAAKAAAGKSSAPESDPRVIDRPINLGFEGPIEDGFPHGWFNSCGHVSQVSTDYSVRVIQRDDSVPGMCLKLFKRGARLDEFGSVMQRFPAEFLRGQTVRLEGDLRTEAVSQWAGFWLRADGDEVPDLFFDNMQRQRVTGTTAWTRRAVEGKLPSGTVWVNFGVVLCGNGAVFADNLRFLRWTREGTWIDV